jgi:hypothetical protein
MLRYAGLAAVSEILVPYRSASLTPSVIRPSSTDGLVALKWSEMGLTPAKGCTDYEFIRRATLDITGTLPTSAEVRVFAADRDTRKRKRLIDDLLERPEYADYWTIKWADLLRSTRSALGPKASAAYTEWLRSSLSRNVPYDKMVRELITASGPSKSVAPANYYRVAASPEELTETTSQLFLGVRLQCARCHHHPFEKWSQTDYYRFAAIFARTGQRNQDAGDTLILARNDGEVAHPKTQLTMTPAALAMDGAPGYRSSADRREALAAWLTSKQNLASARVLVNRYWAHFLGRGIVDPVDDVRVTNPPSNPELLDLLARDFVRGGFDLKKLIRQICLSQAYQLSATPSDPTISDRKFYSHFLPRRQPAEVLLDSLCSATGVGEKFAGLPAGTRAIQLPDSGVASMFLDTFGRPPRSSACECERTAEPSLPQALQLLTGEALNKKVVSPMGRAASLAASSSSPEEIVDDLYLTTLCRTPTKGERTTALKPFSSRSKKEATEDLLWALLNTKEFLYIQ